MEPVKHHFDASHYGYDGTGNTILRGKTKHLITLIFKASSNLIKLVELNFKIFIFFSKMNS
jgi:hypothetical protein